MKMMAIDKIVVINWEKELMEERNVEEMNLTKRIISRYIGKCDWSHWSINAQLKQLYGSSWNLVYGYNLVTFWKYNQWCETEAAAGTRL